MPTQAEERCFAFYEPLLAEKKDLYRGVAFAKINEKAI